MFLLLTACARLPDDPPKGVVDTGAGWAADTAPPDPEDPRVVFLDPASGEVHSPDQLVRVEILTGDDAPMDELTLAWTGVAEGAAGAPSTPGSDGKAVFTLDPLPLGEYEVGVVVTDVDGRVVEATVGFSVVVLDADGDGFDNAALFGDDCDDADPDVNPDATEVCDTVDNDCDDRVDEGVTDPYYADADGDGFGDRNARTDACEPSDGLVADDTDCDDGSADVFPGNPESCDERDNDCDDIVDEDVESPFYRDVDGDGFGDDADVDWACAAPVGYVAPSGDCDDLEPTVSPAASEICMDGLDNDCDGTSNGCALAGTVDLDVADARLYGEEEDANVGQSLAAAGDWDGDGLADVLVGAPGAGGGAGAAYVLPGPLASITGTGSASIQLLGDTSGDSAGYAVAGLGDVDGDGFGDVLIGGYGADAGGTDAGGAWLVRGPDLGARDLSTADLVLVGEDAGDQAGLAVTAAGDLDGDGLDDVAIGAWLAEGYAGRAYVLLAPGSGTLDLSAADAVITGEDPGDFLGQGLAGPGDLDGDGVDDLAVGAPGTASGTGTVYVFSGMLGAISPGSAVATVEGGVADDAVGAALARGGDVDGDGAADLLFGASGYDYGGTNTGGAFLFFGPLSGALTVSDADSLMAGEHASDNAGWSVGGAGDMDGDGQDDVLVGAARADGGGSSSGAAYLVYGPAASVYDLGGADARLLGVNTDDYAGASVAGAGDTDGDGKEDILVGAPYEDQGLPSHAGSAYLVLGTGM